MLPSPGATAIAKAWLDAMPYSLQHDITGQWGLVWLAGKAFTTCTTLQECDEAARLPGGLPLVRTTLNLWPEMFAAELAADPKGCQVCPPWLPRPQSIDPCTPGFPHLYAHILGVKGVANKIERMKSFGLWFMAGEESCGGGGAGKEAATGSSSPLSGLSIAAGALGGTPDSLPRCTPLAWHDTQVEGRLAGCTPPARLAFRY